MKKLTPLKAIRRQCLSCMGGSFKLVADCPGLECSLYPYRFGRLDGADGRTLRAIREYCLECAGSAYEVKTCQGDKAADGPCPLYGFRLGKNPNISEETRKKRREIALRHGFGNDDKHKLHERVFEKRRPKLPLYDTQVGQNDFRAK